MALAALDAAAILHYRDHLVRSFNTLGVTIAIATATVIGALPASATAATQASGLASVPSCEVSSSPSGPLLDHGRSLEQFGTPPAGWQAPTTFDWNRDGRADELTAADGQVTLRWVGGSLTVTGVRTDFPDLGAAPPRLAAATDLTGDGVVDLAVAHDGEVAVLVGQQSSGSAQVSFADIGTSVPGWRSPAPTDEQVPAPLRLGPGNPASVHPLWDVDGDAIADLAVGVEARRTHAPLTLYAGRVCNGLTDPVPGLTGDPEPAIGFEPNARQGRPTVYSGDFPDPDLLRVGSTYYAYGTNGFTPFAVWRNLPVMTSNDLVSWSGPGEALPSLGSWANAGLTWAPSVHRFGGTYVLFYTAQARTDPAQPKSYDGEQCIGRATSSSPTGPFVDNAGAPFLCQGDRGGSIDAEVFVDSSGVPWLLWKNDGNAPTCACNTYLWSQRLNSAGSGFTEAERPLLQYDSSAVESPTIEGPAMVNSTSGHWLFYSSGAYDSGNYKTGLAHCQLGPGAGCVRRDSRWLESTPHGSGPGGASFSADPLGRVWMAYHGWRNGVIGYENLGARSLFIDRVDFAGAVPAVDVNAISPRNPFGSLDSAVSGPGTVTVSGWTIDPDTSDAIDVTVTIDGAAVASAEASTSRPDVGAAYPGAGPNHGFSITLDASGGQHTVCVRGENVQLGAGSSVVGCRTVTIPSRDPFGSIDSIVVSFDQLRVSGWAIDPDTTGPITTLVRVDGTVVSTAPAQMSRPDVGAAYPAFGALHGYEVVVPIGTGTHQVCVDLIDIGPGVDVSLGCRSVTRTSGNPFGWLDGVTLNAATVDVSGWSIDPDTTSPVAIHVYVDGTWGGQTTANQSRPDVGAAYPGYGSNRGFRLSLPRQVGRKQVCAYAINAGPGTTNPLIGCRTLDMGGGVPFGSVDGVTGGAGKITLTGWSVDPDTTSPVAIHVYVDGAWGGQTTANQSRPDVGAAFPGYGSNHGFTAVVTAGAGAHQVCAYAINVGPGDTNPLIACRNVTLA